MNSSFRDPKVDVWMETSGTRKDLSGIWPVLSHLICGWAGTGSTQLDMVFVL